jgi:exonuclease SbcC
MRPVRLEMEGFASFRERAVVDFEEADYFAIVGPTGSGKSTLVDAMTFALFGSAPRWGRKNAVSMALSPHGNRAVVRLVFELGAHRYVVAREVRRTGASTTARNQRLERLPSLQSLGGPDDITVPLAADSKVTEAVETLLGLTFEQFRQCVVLPQNAFAEFLHSTPKDRQEILLRLIGAEHYELIRGEANQRAQAAQAQVEHLDRMLGELGDATPEAEATAAQREAQVSAVVSQVREALPALASAQEALDEALRTEQRLGLERDRLAAIVVPAGVSEIDRAVSAAQESAAVAAGVEARAEEADTAARERLSGAVPRGPLEQAVKDHVELGRLTAERPALTSAESSARAGHESAGHQVTAAELRQVQAQAANERAMRTADEARRRVIELEGQHTLLTRPALPSGLNELDRDLAAARATLESARSALTELEKADDAAAQALSSGPPRGPLERARQTLEELAALGGRLSEFESRVSEARAEAVKASEAVEARIAAVREARQQRDEVQVRHAAASLRGRLVVGDECPVCAQTVAVLPGGVAGAEVAGGTAGRGQMAVAERSGVGRSAVTAPGAAAEPGTVTEPDAMTEPGTVTEPGAVTAGSGEPAGRQASAEATHGGVGGGIGPDGGAGPYGEGGLGHEGSLGHEAGRQVTSADPELVAADAAIASAESALDRARTAHNKSARAESVAESNLGSARQRVEELRGSLPRACPDLATADRLLGELVALEAAQRQAALQVRQARGTVETARRHGEQLAATEAQIRSGLGQTRDPLVALGAPAVEELPLAEAWQRLIGWAAERAEALGTELTGARQERETADAAQQLTTKELSESDGGLRSARTAQANTLAAAERARERLEQAEQRLARLTADLATAPAESDAREKLREIDALEAAVRVTDEELRLARQGRERARRTLASLDDQLTSGWAVLRRTRDGVVQLGAPELTADGLLACWTGLSEWSTAAAHDREVALTTARAATAADRERAEQTRSGVADVLNQASIPVAGDDLATTALASATGAQAEARAALTRIRERRAQASQVLTERAGEEGRAHVAKMLGDLLRADKFPRWLATAALESLVIEASDTLLRLSNGQFDLDHDDKGDLVVVDHTDADARRSVKTLSGGETFQASLAMALALSSQMSQLSSAGGARLDSIFLDEGFGTLDPDTLETVAGTLENLARGERMVGVITHVPALADRVPVRFNVRRDAQTSRVERQNL